MTHSVLQRADQGDFREVGGVMIPFQLDLEFNARFGRTEDEQKTLRALAARPLIL